MAGKTTVRAQGIAGHLLIEASVVAAFSAYVALIAWHDSRDNHLFSYEIRIPGDYHSGDFMAKG
jgi:hypothetical protein